MDPKLSKQNSTACIFISNSLGTLGLPGLAFRDVDTDRGGGVTVREKVDETNR
jgi:hypothetical protein